LAPPLQRGKRKLLKSPQRCGDLRVSGFDREPYCIINSAHTNKSNTSFVAKLCKNCRKRCVTIYSPWYVSGFFAVTHPTTITDTKHYIRRETAMPCPFSTPNKHTIHQKKPGFLPKPGYHEHKQCQHFSSLNSSITSSPFLPCPKSSFGRHK
jgi:hypothetical protein